MTSKYKSTTKKSINHKSINQDFPGQTRISGSSPDYPSLDKEGWERFPWGREGGIEIYRKGKTEQLRPRVEQHEQNSERRGSKEPAKIEAQCGRSLRDRITCLPYRC